MREVGEASGSGRLLVKRFIRLRNDRFLHLASLWPDCISVGTFVDRRWIPPFWRALSSGVNRLITLHRDLGISTRSLVHHWSKGGAPGQIPGYATHMDEVAKAAKYLKYGGYIGIALTGTASAAKVQEVCRAGETEACEKIRYTEAGSFVGGMGGGGVAVPLASRLAAAPICAAIGFGSGGIGGIVCGLVVVGGASYAGGEGGEWVGEWMGENIYEVRK